MPRTFEELFGADEIEDVAPLDYVLIISRSRKAWLDALVMEACREREESGERFNVRGGFRYEDGSEDDETARRTAPEIAKRGIYGEWAGHVMFGWPFNERYHRLDDTKDHDASLHGRRIQVKSRRRLPSGAELYLMFRDVKHFSADIAVLMEVHEPGDGTVIVRCCGWAGKRDWLKRNRPRQATKIGGLQPTMLASEMRQPDTLIPTLERATATTEQTVDLFTGARTAEEEAELAREWEADEADAISERAARRQQQRENQEIERLFLFKREQQRRKEKIESGEVPQPPDYVGKVFDRATNQGVAYDSTPPYRDDPFSGLTEAFVDFQTHHHLTVVRTNPENYCTECGDWFAAVVCPYEGCRSGRVTYPKPNQDGPGMRAYHCNTCRRGFEAERVCAHCRAKRPEVQAQLQLEAQQRAAKAAKAPPKRKTTTNKAATRAGKQNARVYEDDFYPD